MRSKCEARSVSAEVVLKIALDPERLPNVEPATLRVFCFDATSGEWQLVPRSGARAEAGYAWAHLQRPGLYIAIGLPAGANALVTVLTTRALMPRLRAAPDEAARRRVLELISELLSPNRAGRTEAAGAAAALDIAGLDVGARGLPEFDIFDDICRRRRRLGERTSERRSLSVFDGTI